MSPFAKRAGELEPDFWIGIIEKFRGRTDYFRVREFLGQTQSVLANARMRIAQRPRDTGGGECAETVQRAERVQARERVRTFSGELCQRIDRRSIRAPRKH